MKATLTHLGNNDQDIEFGEYTRLRFDFGDAQMKFIEVAVGKCLDNTPCLDIRSGWNGLVIEPIVSNAIKVRMTKR